ncbi:hypothetical protein HGRIS_005032 [Hohenbuehelia grisea]|uniref:J domain-containing protein n=1 Tax=Hohenbuehelia grisea TaxID=104357 RepID=A0ABR3JE80_9AGAR
MESNKDEALRSYQIACRHRDSGNITSALKFCQTSIRLFPTPQAEKLAQQLADLASSSASTSGSSASATEEHPSSAGVKHRHTSKSNGSSTTNGTAGGSNGDKREYTPEQLAVVKRVRTCKVTEYYEILAVQKECSEAEVKKAYRKANKNGAPGADEAFKLVSKAFQVLSDPQKRAVFDRSGGDPESRFSGMSSGPSFARGGGGAAFEGELSPEDLFNMFFGGGMGPMGGAQFGGGFGGPGVFTASFGPGGFRTNRQSTAQQRPAGNNQPAEARSALVQLLPLLLLFGFSFISSIPSLFSSGPSTVPDPLFSLRPTQRYVVERWTSNLGTPYWVEPKEFWGHAYIGQELGRQGETLQRWNEEAKTWKAEAQKEEEEEEEATKRWEEEAAKAKAPDAKPQPEDSEGTKRALKVARRAARRKARAQRRAAAKAFDAPSLARFEAAVERAYTSEMYSACQSGLERRERRKDAEVGIFGIGTDWPKVRAIEREKVEACEVLRSLGILRQ